MTIPEHPMKMALVVEDDPVVLMVLEETLDHQGYAVVSARSSGEALNILGSGAYVIDVLVADIRLGDGLDGWEIARCAREIEPSLPIVYVTGDSYGQFKAEGVPQSLMLRKPFTMAELTEAIVTLTGPADDAT